MWKSHYFDVPIVVIIRESHAHGVAATSKKYRVSSHTTYIWRKRCGCTEPSQVSEIKRNTQEYARLIMVVAERHFEIEVMKELAAKWPYSTVV